MLNLNFHVINV